jgi:hypothetical protein
MLGSDLLSTRTVLESASEASRAIHNTRVRLACVGLLTELDLWRGNWAAAERRPTTELEDIGADTQGTAILHAVLAEKLVLSGSADPARERMQRAQEWAASGSAEFRASYAVVSALVLSQRDLGAAADQ